MPRRPSFTSSEVARLIKGALEGGWAWGSFKVVAEGGRLALIPINAVAARLDELDAELAEWDRVHGRGTPT